MVQLDLTNAYLNAPIKDTVYVYIPKGYPGEGEIARLDKAKMLTFNFTMMQW